MNPKGDGVHRRSLLVRNIFMRLILLQILSNSVLAFLLKPLKKRLSEGQPLSDILCWIRRGYLLMGRHSRPSLKYCVSFWEFQWALPVR